MRKHIFLFTAISLAALSGCGGDEAPSDTSQTATAPGATAPTGARPGAFRQCAICHAVEPDAAAMVGPNLAGIYGASAGQRPNFAYSDALQDSGIIWSDDTLDAFLKNPLATVPGNRMAFAGERDASRRAEIIAYLKTLN